MKKSILLAFVTLFTVSLTLGAQNQKSKLKDDKNVMGKNFSCSDRADRLIKQLKLPDTQKMELELYFMNVDRRREETLETLKKLPKGDKTRKKILEEERIKNDNDLRSIIGSEKMNKYLQIRENQEYKRRN